jgi:hypothetical protein
VEKLLRQAAALISANTQGSEDAILVELKARMEPYLAEARYMSDPAAIGQVLTYQLYNHAFSRVPITVDVFLAIFEALLELIFPFAKQTEDTKPFLQRVKRRVESI